MLDSNALQILSAVSDGVMVVDKRFKIVFVNAAFMKITGLTETELVGKYCKHALQGEMCRDGCPVAELLEQGESQGDSVSIIRNRLGERKSIRLHSHILKNELGEADGSVIIIHDFSSLKDSESGGNSHSFYGIVGVSKAMREIFSLIDEISHTDATVFITGESGTGKELIANAIQQTSQRKDKPYIKVNCSVFTPQLLASELFGHVKGAFTGADRNRAGRFEVADGGTLFLDEIGEMPPQMQVQLLRVLQENTFERVGESVSRTVDVRVIAATNKDIARAIEEKAFREDLFYRLNVVPIHLPPLRERREDIPRLAAYFLKKYYHSSDRLPLLNDRVMDVLMTYEWPGNVRELENCIAYAVARNGTSEVIKLDKLPPQLKSMAHSHRIIATEGEMTEREKILLALQKHRWKKSNAAQELGISRVTLWRKMKLYNLVD